MTIKYKCAKCEREFFRGEVTQTGLLNMSCVCGCHSVNQIGEPLEKQILDKLDILLSKIDKAENPLN